MDNCKTASHPSHACKLLLWIVHRSDRIANVGCPRRTCPNQFIALLNTYHSNAMRICVLVKNRFFSRFLSPNCRLLCNSLVLMSFYQVQYASSSCQNARTGQICCLFSTYKVWKVFSFRGASLPCPHQGLCPWTAVISSRSALAMAWPPPMKISACAPATAWNQTKINEKNLNKTDEREKSEKKQSSKALKAVNREVGSCQVNALCSVGNIQLSYNWQKREDEVSTCINTQQLLCKNHGSRIRVRWNRICQRTYVSFEQ